MSYTPVWGLADEKAKDLADKQKISYEDAWTHIHREGIREVDSGRVMDDQTKRLVLKRAEEASRFKAERG